MRWPSWAFGAALGIFLIAGASTAQSPKPPQYSPKLQTPELTCKGFDVMGREIYRSWTRRELFVKMTGGDRPGMYVNHIVPLACGGCDVPSNMEWMTQAGWAGRMGPERYDCGRHAGGSW